MSDSFAGRLTGTGRTQPKFGSPGLTTRHTSAALKRSTEPTSNSFDSPLNRNLSGIDHKTLRFPRIVSTFKHALPCRQYVARNISTSPLHSQTVRRSIGTDQLNLEDTHACFERHISPAATRKVQGIDRVRDHGRSKPQVIARNGIGGQISGRSDIRVAVTGRNKCLLQCVDTQIDRSELACEHLRDRCLSGPRQSSKNDQHLHTPGAAASIELSRPSNPFISPNASSNDQHAAENTPAHDHSPRPLPAATHTRSPAPQT